MTGAPSETTLTVMCRVRPPRESVGEASESPACLEVVSAPDAQGGDRGTDVHESATVSVQSASARGSRVFERVYGPGATQEAVWEGVGRPSVAAFRDGAHASVISYGQTGSGKTWTMMGSFKHGAGGGNAGIVPRAIAELLGDKGSGLPERSTLTASYVEVYLDGFKDLLAPAPGPGSSASGIAVKESAERGVHLAGAKETGPLGCEADALEALHRGNRLRSTRATDCNAASSRSHALFCLHLRKREDGTTNTLILADLAGSEKAKKTGAEGKGLSEGNAINRSLSALGLVVKALSEGAPHVPFRDSLLTRVLQDSLTRRGAKTALLIAMSPDADSAEETLSSLRFAKLCQRVRLTKAEVPQDPISFEPRTMKDAQRVIRTLRTLVASLQAAEDTKGAEAVPAKEDDRPDPSPNGAHAPCSPPPQDWWRTVIAQEGEEDRVSLAARPAPLTKATPRARRGLLYLDDDRQGMAHSPTACNDSDGGGWAVCGTCGARAGTLASAPRPTVHMCILCASWWTLALTLACTLAA